MGDQNQCPLIILKGQSQLVTGRKIQMVSGLIQQYQIGPLINQQRQRKPGFLSP